MLSLNAQSTWLSSQINSSEFKDLRDKMDHLKLESMSVDTNTETVSIQSKNGKKVNLNGFQLLALLYKSVKNYVTQPKFWDFQSTFKQFKKNNVEKYLGPITLRSLDSSEQQRLANRLRLSSSESSDQYKSRLYQANVLSRSAEIQRY